MDTITVARRPRDQMMRRLRDVSQTCFLNSTYKNIKLSQDFILNSSSKKFCDQYGG